MKFPKSKRYRSTVKFWPFNHTILRLSFLFILLLQLSTHATAQTGSIPSSSDTIPDGSYGPTISKNMALVLIAFVCVFFFIGFISIYIRHCTELRFGTALSLPSVHGGAGTSRSRREARGIDATVIATFPTFVYSSVKGHKLGKDSLECAVCLNEFEGDDTLRLLPKCSHVFHSGCIDAWLEAHCTCPVCRANLVPGESGEPDGRSGLNPLTENQVRVHVVEIDDDQQQAVRERESLDVNLLNQDRPGPRRLRSTGWRFGGMFSRSNSTGHLPVQPCESHERFTLRLPEDVRSQLLNSNLNRARSCVPAFQRIQSSRQGYRSRSTGGSGPERSDFMVERLDRGNRSDRWTSLIMPTPFFGMGRPVGIQKTVGCGEEEVDVGERSIVRPAPA